MSLTPEAKKVLAETVRDLRTKLLVAVHDESDRRYRLSVSLKDAGLDEAHRRRRGRIEAWIDEQARAQKTNNAKELRATKDRLLAQAEKEAAATFINRLVLLRQLEAAGLSRPQVVTGGWNSKGYREFRDFAPTLCINGTTDATEGYSTLLGLVFDELAVDLPGLFGDVGLTKLFPIAPATLREAIERLDDPELASAWMDDTTLGWVYQYWNDPDRDALDAKINRGGKIEPHEIASKTQMFTERYIVEWLLQNSLGVTWLAMCKKHSWSADAERLLPTLDVRREEWRKKRESGEVALDALMPIESELEDHWKYFVPQPVPVDAVAHAPESVRAIKLLDPACGSGHFLVIAFDLLAALYREEARHRGQKIDDCDIAESILEHNLHGIDIDPRAIQIAAAGLYLKCRTFSTKSRPRAINLVAPALQLGNLPTDDPAVMNLRVSLWAECGIPPSATDGLLKALAGVDHLGSLLKLDASVDEALREAEEFQRSTRQQKIFEDGSRQTTIAMPGERQNVTDKLEGFLVHHSKSEDLGLRLDGEQLASGVRFVRMAKEGAYDIVVGNPPYQGLSKTESLGYVANTYPRGKADLYAAFLERGLQLVRPGGISALLTMRGWIFLNQFRELREHLLRTAELRALVDLDSGAFEEVSAAQVVLSVACSVFLRVLPESTAVALRPTPTEDRASAGMTARKRAGLVAHVGRYEFDPRGFEVIEGEPIVYWWPDPFLRQYGSTTKFGACHPARQGLGTRNDVRFLRRWWEPARRRIWVPPPDTDVSPTTAAWVPYIKGAAGQRWYEPLDFVLRWEHAALQLRVWIEHYRIRAPGQYIKNESFYFRRGVAFTTIGSHFSARIHRFASVFGEAGSSVFVPDLFSTVCTMNASRAGFILASLNPSVNFKSDDVNRLSVFTIEGADAIGTIVRDAFVTEERQREASVEFREPGPSSWLHAQAWAQAAVDRADAAPLPPYEPQHAQSTLEARLSASIGVALGRFDGSGGAGILEAAPPTALPAGILFVSSEGNDSLDHDACERLVSEFRSEAEDCVETRGQSLSEYLRKAFFGYHKKVYDSRPIYFPLSSAKKNFVAFILIQRWQSDTLKVVLADCLVPTRRRLEGELDDLRTARASGTSKGKAERRFAEVQKLVEELNDFIAKITEVADKGPPPPDDKTPRREVDAKYVMNLDDGVMVNSAALWTLLEPQWKDPRKWWWQIASEKGPKGTHFDWSEVAERYFPVRVRKKCHEDPSLAVAHKCFWDLHPAKAYAWELRLQDEIKPDFTIDEPGSDDARSRFLSGHEFEAKEIHASEMKRRERKAKKERVDDQSDEPLFDRAGDDEEDETDND